MGGTIALAVIGFLFVVANSAGLAGAAGLNQGVVVPEDARRDLPVVLDGRVLAHAQVGDRIFVGGDFQQVELIDGTVITQPYLFAYDIDTGIVDPNFRPVLSNLVRTLEAKQAGDGLYVGGLFTRWDDSFPLRIASLDAEGNLDTTFNARASARVQTIAEVGNSLFIGGDFTDVSGTAVTGLAKVDSTTGAVDTSFSPVLSGFVAGNSLVKTIDATPDGSSLFVLHYASQIDGLNRTALAKFDIAGNTATLSGWNVPWNEQAGNANCASALRDMAVSPDGTYLVVGGQGADRPPNCDSVLRYSTAGNTTVNFDWSARMYSSVFSLAVSDVAVYVGGHFCAAPLNGAPPGGVTSDFAGTANQCDINNPDSPVNPSVIDPTGAVFRSQMAALNPANGQALAWDPGSNNFVGVFDLTLIDRGLLAGHDTDRFSTFLVGRSGFFDIDGAGADTTAPEVFVTNPADGAVFSDSPTELAGTAVDDREVVDITVRLRNQTTGLNLQPNGTFAAATADLPVTVTTTGLGQVAWSVPVANLPAGEYEVRVFASDAFGNSAPTELSNFTIAGTATCTVALNDDDLPEITIDQFVADSNNLLVVRRNGSWLETIATDATSYVDNTATPGDYSYVMRWRPNGTTTDVTCSPATITVPQGGGAITCSAGLDANGDPILSWDLVAGVSNYIVRDQNGWVDTVTNASTYTDAGVAPGDYSYTIRIRTGGVTTDIACSPSPLTVTGDGGGVPTCNASVNGAGEVVLSWDIPGESTFQVRDDDGWVATVDGATTFTHTNPETGARNYVIRYRSGGVQDISCSPSPVIVN